MTRATCKVANFYKHYVRDRLSCTPLHADASLKFPHRTSGGPTNWLHVVGSLFSYKPLSRDSRLYSVNQLTLLAGNTAGHALTAGSHKQALRHVSRTRRPRYQANAYSTVQGAVPVRSAHIPTRTHHESAFDETINKCCCSPALRSANPRGSLVRRAQITWAVPLASELHLRCAALSDALTQPQSLTDRRSHRQLRVLRLPQSTSMAPSRMAFHLPS